MVSGTQPSVMGHNGDNLQWRPLKTMGTVFQHCHGMPFSYPPSKLGALEVEMNYFVSLF